MTKEEKYISEVRMRLTKSGFSVLPVDDGCLPVLCDCDAPEKMQQIDTVTRQATVVREYMQAFDTAQAMKLPHLEVNYKLLADFNGTCLAARESEHGMQFATWNYPHDSVLIRAEQGPSHKAGHVPRQKQHRKVI